MALSGFLVPFASGALIKRQEIADEYDETAGEIIDAASEKYNLKFDQNQSQIELQKLQLQAKELEIETQIKAQELKLKQEESAINLALKNKDLEIKKSQLELNEQELALEAVQNRPVGIGPS